MDVEKQKLINTLKQFGERLDNVRKHFKELENIKTHGKYFNILKFLNGVEYLENSAHELKTNDAISILFNTIDIEHHEKLEYIIYSTNKQSPNSFGNIQQAIEDYTCWKFNGKKMVEDHKITKQPMKKSRLIGYKGEHIKALSNAVGFRIIIDI